MNLRDIKKDIEYVVSAFIDDCYLVATVNPKVSDDSLAALLDEAVDLFNDMRDKAVAKVEGPKKAYYDDIRRNLLDSTDALYEKLSTIVKDSAKA